MQNGDSIPEIAPTNLQGLPPPLQEPLQMSTAQVALPGKITVLLTFDGPGKRWQGNLEAEDAERWANQLLHYAKMSKAGLLVGEQK